MVYEKKFATPFHTQPLWKCLPNSFKLETDKKTGPTLGEYSINKSFEDNAKTCEDTSTEDGSSTDMDATTDDDTINDAFGSDLS